MQSNQNSYNKIANDFNDQRSKSKMNPYIEKFAEELPESGHVLDIGCGSGVPNAKYLVQSDFNLVGIDPSEELIKLAEKNVPQAKFLNSGILKFETDQKFDGIIAWDSLFHLKLDEHEEAFKKITSLLKPIGYFLFTHGGSEGEIESEMYNNEFYYSSPGPDKIKSMLQELGYEILEWDLNMEEGNGYLIVLARKI
ncbi:methyltransferase domain-containing protein [Candidatus Dojkabacteria bacterium]|nr:methyltransferase domain-containing protein [Candidatus Dojkabacteria bacterium]